MGSLASRLLSTRSLAAPSHVNGHLGPRRGAARALWAAESGLLATSSLNGSEEVIFQPNGT